jgi:predicted phage terminase large subunit-like protein
MKSQAEILSALPADERARILSGLTEEQFEQLTWEWRFWARPNQLLPNMSGSSNLFVDADGRLKPWVTWLILAGRGFGKSRTGSETIRQLVYGVNPRSPLSASGGYSRIALVGETAADARDVMVEGDSGILRCHSKEFRPLYEPSKRRLTWPNGAVATLYNGVEPDQLRGPQHDLAWCDELAKFRYADETWDQLQFGLRLGKDPKQIVTTTPRPIPVIRKLILSPSTVVTRGSTYDNRGNLAESFFQSVVTRYEGTRLGRQELDAEILDDVVGALWSRDMLDKARRKKLADNSYVALPDMARVVVAVDPSGTGGSEDAGDSVGIIVAGRDKGRDKDSRAYVLADKTIKAGPDTWARTAVRAYYDHHADCIVAERNFGGAMVEHVIRTVDPRVPVKMVSASRGKVVRAEPVAALYEQERIVHKESFYELEDQMVMMTHDGFLGDGSPDRVDALVWALSELMLERQSLAARVFNINHMGR